MVSPAMIAWTMKISFWNRQYCAITEIHKTYFSFKSSLLIFQTYLRFLSCTLRYFLEYYDLKSGDWVVYLYGVAYEYVVWDFRWLLSSGLEPEVDEEGMALPYIICTVWKLQVRSVSVTFFHCKNSTNESCCLLVLFCRCR